MGLAEKGISFQKLKCIETGFSESENKPVENAKRR
jgi:hypothetical protein